MDSILSGNILLVVLYTLIVAPIAEEIVFRGVILHKAGRNVPFWGANILQAMFFGLYHQNLIQGLYATLIGLLLGLIYRKYQTIAAPILLHMIINAAAFLVITLSLSYLSNIVMAIAGAAFILIAMKGLVLVTKG
jgi:membrane protease YdiL (CAAX protease family)